METNSKEEEVTPQPTGEPIAEPAEGPIAEVPAAEDSAPEPTPQEASIEEEPASEPELPAIEPPIESPEAPAEAAEETAPEAAQPAEETSVEKAPEAPVEEVPALQEPPEETTGEEMRSEETPLEPAAENPMAETTAAPQGESAPAQTEFALVDEGAAPGEPIDPLADLAARSQAARLSVADEEQMSRLLKEALLAGRAGVGKAVDFLPVLPWIVGVRAVESTWPEMKITARAHLLKGLADIESDSARRIRLSLARALFKLDPSTSMKLTVGVCKEFKDKDSGALSQKHAQIFANVFIGKVKPWLSQIALADIKPADADLLAHCALMAVFSLPHPPVTQLGVLKWTGDAGRLAKLVEPAAATIIKSVSRWSPRWQIALYKEVPSLPAEIAQVLKHVNQATPDEATSGEPAADAAPFEETVIPEQEEEKQAEATAPVVEAPRKPRPVYEPRPQKPPINEPEAPRDRGRDAEREQRKERPVYQGRNEGRNAAGGNFNLTETLRQIETHVQSLRSELNAAQAKLSDREEENRRGANRRSAPERPAVAIPGEPTVEELARLNLQLEARITELQHRIDELGIDAEDRAASMGAHSDEQVTDVNQQLRTLLGFKLQDDYADFAALEGESTSVVVQQHYRSLLRHIFEVLKHEGVELKG
ncbi:MAG: hypothetical protein JWL90_2903 [Chthoniobacteraceae bacterium]|nr:hypothetical protein [Chthoniobacteraceae bacterium]